VYPELGHKLVMEQSERTARDALAFLAGADVGGDCGTPGDPTAEPPAPPALP
jgi:hypothetical protein